MNETKEDLTKLKNAVKQQNAHLKEIALMYVKLKDIRDDLKRSSEELDDAGDPSFDAETAMLNLGDLLADLVLYKSFYEEKIEEENEKSE